MLLSKFGKCSLVWSITIVAVENTDMFICGTEGGGGYIAGLALAN